MYNLNPVDKKEILKSLLDDVALATEAHKLATEQFKAVIKSVPSELPHPDGVQRILNVSAGASHARNKLRVARARLEQYQQHGYIPVDLR